MSINDAPAHMTCISLPLYNGPWRAKKLTDIGRSPADETTFQLPHRYHTASTMYTKSLLVATFLVLGATVAFTSECKMIWIFGIPCRDVYVTLVTQIKNWRSDGSCITGGQSCLYELVSTTPYVIKAKHTSPRTKFSNTFQIIFNPAEEATMCRVTGDSISDIFVDPVDSDINYCSLQNLIDGSGLSKVDGYKHFTNEYICVESHAPNCTIG